MDTSPCIKEVVRSASVAFAPDAPFLAAGTMAGAVDMSFSSSANLEIFQLDFQSDDRKLPLVGAVSSPEPFNRLSWGKSPSSGSEEFSLGLVAGGLVDGNIGIWNPRLLIGSSEKSESSVVQTLSRHRGPDFAKAVMGARWKAKGSEVKALANPISKSVSSLQSSLIESNSQGILSGCSVLLASNPEQAELLNQTCFGRPVITVDNDKKKHWFQFTLEEAFYLCYSLKCMKIIDGDHNIKTNNELWEYMVSRKASFPYFFKAYSHLRIKNWVVRSGCQYGVDFVAYRHHPSLVHSEFGVLVFADGNGNDRLRVWSDFQCMLRLCGSVAKTLLILHVNRVGENVIDSSPSCLDGFSVDAQTITRWSPERCREAQAVK